jgi:fatty-acid desaturase
MFSLICFFIFSYYWHGLGVTVGYHRLLSHRAFKCNKLVEYFWIISGYLAFEGSPAWWATVHRVHHRNADQENDPHSPDRGSGHAYFSWMFKQNEELINIHKVAPDLMKDPVYQFMAWGDDALMLTVNVAFRLIIWLFFGWQMALTSLLAGIFVLQIPLMLNLFCHITKLGYKNHNLNNHAVNVWWVALLAAGEGWHNNHHAHPSSAKSGERWFEFDLSWNIIQFMHALGLVSRYNLPAVTTTAADRTIVAGAKITS